MESDLGPAAAYFSRPILAGEYGTMRPKLDNNKRLWYTSDMKPKKPSAISQAATMLGKKGGKRTLTLYGPEHFSKANKARKTRGGGWPKGRPRKPKAGKKDGGQK